MVFSYVHDEDGDRHECFHLDCYRTWRSKHPLPADDLPDRSQLIEDIDGGPPEGY